MYQSINPFSEIALPAYPYWSSAQIEQSLQRTRFAAPRWARTPLAERSAVLGRVAEVLVENQEDLAILITSDMGKLIAEARAEIQKCAHACQYYVQNGHLYLQDEIVPTDAAKSYIRMQALGCILAMMPWNFPFWQVMRAAVPALLAGNTMILKHSSNVPACAMALVDVFREAGLPAGCFENMWLNANQVAQLIGHPAVTAVTFTGSEQAGRQVAALAGQNLKKAVLELGGSDPFIILEDADLDLTILQAMSSRFLNCGQSCIAAKRFIVVEPIAAKFVNGLREAVSSLKYGDPILASTTLAPMARADLRQALHAQVQQSLALGAQASFGCQFIDSTGFFYSASLLDHVRPGMPAFDEELFGPVAAVVRVPDVQTAIEMANATRFGLGASIWTRDVQLAENLAKEIQSGMVFINAMVKSDPRLPFGGTKDSGYGRELSALGMREFINSKTIYVASG